MKGSREQYEKSDDESLFDLYKRNTPHDEKTYVSIRSAWRYLQEFLENQDYETLEMGDKEAKEFADYLEEVVHNSGSSGGSLSLVTADNYLKLLSRLFGWVVQNTSYADWEPFGSLHNSYYEYDDRDIGKRDVPIADLRQGIQNIKDVKTFIFIFIALKTGLRFVEILNLDLRDLHIDHPINEIMPDPRKEIADKPNALYVDSSKAGNKTKSFREIPIDDELLEVLVWYIGMTPPRAEKPKPLLVSLVNSNTKYKRVSTGPMKRGVRRWSNNNGWYIEPDHPKNVTAHWCRHWFSTVLRVNIDDDDVLFGGAKEYVKGLRGDSGNDIIDTYSHQWDSLRDPDDPEWREIYTDAMPSLLVKPDNPSIEPDESWRELKNFVEENTVIY